MEDDDLKAVAQEYVNRLGCGAVHELNELAEISAGAGDHDSAQTWREIARVAQALLK